MAANITFIVLQVTNIRIAFTDKNRLRIMDNLTNIQHLTSEWFKLIENGKEEEAASFYCEKIIPYLAPTLKSNFKKAYKRNASYEVLISLLGYAPETIVIAYQTFNPKILVVLHTKETEHLLDKVINFTKIPIAKFFHEPFEEHPQTDIYRALESVLKRFPGKSIIMELTGGKKTMSSALSVASGMLNNNDLVFIDYTKYNSTARKPEPESVYIHLVESPLKLPFSFFYEADTDRAAHFFNEGKYIVSKTLFEEISQRVSTPRVPEACAKLSDFYSAWNKFDFNKAVVLSEELIQTMSSFYSDISKVFQFNLGDLFKQKQSITALAQGDRHSILWNFYFSAERYEKGSFYDIAALLYYRTIENVFENSLRSISNDFTTEEPDYSLISNDLNILTTKYNESRNKIFKQEQKELPLQLAMLDAFFILESVNHFIASSRAITGGRIADIAKIRNRSIYAHGTNPIDEGSVKKIKKLATELVEIYAENMKIGVIESQRRNFEFIKLILINNSN